MSLYKLFNWLFGWDYIYWSSSGYNGIARIFRIPSGELVYYRYRIINLIDTIHEPKQVLWLTCKPEKYFPNITTTNSNT